ncbi:MAG: hypothetical protein QNJ07_10965 [Woeseiaceae bacterium]|nr:hypothetical protein [Woeseiaceae bacterium]
MNIPTTVVRIAAITAMLCFLAACQTATTQVDRAARAKVLENAPYDKILVVGVTYRKDTGRAFEKVLVEELANYDTRASAMHTVISTTEVTEDVVRSAAEKVDADAVLIATVENVETDVKFGNRRVDLKERPQNGGLVDFFRHEYEEVTSEPSVDMKFTAVVVSDVYDVESGNRIYTVESATANASSAEEIIVQESAAIVLRMHKDGIIR